MGNQIVDVDFALHIPVDDLRDIGAAPRAAEGGALPDAPGDQLKRPRRNLLPCAGNADDNADTPAAVTAFERLPHDIDIANALEAVIGAALRQIDEIWHEVAFDLLRVDKMGHPEFFSQCPLARVEIDPHDHVGAGHAAPLDHV